MTTASQAPISWAFIIPSGTLTGAQLPCYTERESARAYLSLRRKHAFIGYQIADALAFAEPEGTYRLECLYERSCGAVVCRRINDEIRLLLIKNSRSAHWGFPKGHMERGETPEQTARREVLEETGIHIDIIPDFTAKSDYTIQGKVEKSVTIFWQRPKTQRR